MTTEWYAEWPMMASLRDCAGGKNVVGRGSELRAPFVGRPATVTFGLSSSLGVL